MSQAVTCGGMAALQEAGSSSWGGSLLLEGCVYHLFATRLALGCWVVLAVLPVVVALAPSSQPVGRGLALGWWYLY